MTADVIPPERLQAKREEREQRRQRREVFAGSILSGVLDDDDEPLSAPASRARDMETRR